MQVLRIILMILLVAVCVALSVIILSQEGKSAGLGSLSGQASTNESYWGKNKGRSREGMLVRITTILVVAFFVLSILLNLGSLQ